MRFRAALLLSLLCPGAALAQKWKKLPDGGQYRIVQNAPGNASPETGDAVLLRIQSTPAVPGTEHQRWLVWDGMHRGGMATGLRKMTIGDSAVFRLPADSGVKRPAGYEEFGARLLDIQRVAERRAFLSADPAALQAFEDEQRLIRYFDSARIAPERTASGMYYTLADTGIGRPAKHGESVSMFYTGMRLDGFVFDSNKDSSKGPVKPLTFVLQPGLLVKGFEEALLLLPEGASGRFYLPSGLGYGQNGNGPGIPPDSILIFDIERTKPQ